MNRKEITESRTYQISSEVLKYASRTKNVVEAFEAGAERADKTMIKRAIKWLSLHAELYGGFNAGRLNDLVDNFKQAMEE